MLETNILTLALLMYSVIDIYAQKQSIPTSQPTQPLTSNLCPKISVSNQNSGLTTFVGPYCGIYICPGYVITVNGCPSLNGGLGNGVVCAGDPKIVLVDAEKTLLVENDDSSCVAWGDMPPKQIPYLCPVLNFTVPKSFIGCQIATLISGCFGTGDPNTTSCTLRTMVTVVIPEDFTTSTSVSTFPSSSPSFLPSVDATENSFHPSTSLSIATQSPLLTSLPSIQPSLFPTHRLLGNKKRKNSCASLPISVIDNSSQVRVLFVIFAISAAGMAIVQLIFLQKMRLLPVMLLPSLSFFLCFENCVLSSTKIASLHSSLENILVVFHALQLPLFVVISYEVTHRLHEARLAHFCCIPFDQGSDFTNSPALASLWFVRAIASGLFVMYILGIYAFDCLTEPSYGGYASLVDNIGSTRLWLTLLPSIVLTFEGIVIGTTLWK